MSIFKNIGLTEFSVTVCERKILELRDFEYVKFPVDIRDVIFVYITDGYIKKDINIYNEGTLFVYKYNNKFHFKGQGIIYYFSFYDSFIDDMFIKEAESESSRKANIKIYNIKDRKECKKCFEQIGFNYKNKDKSFLVTSAIYRLFDIINNSENIISKNAKLPTLIKNYIDDNANCSRKDLIDKFNKNPDYIERAFKKEFNITITQYKNQLRCNNAKVYLKVSDNKISVIAKKVGFSSENQFRLVFERLVGMTPKEYRNKQLKIKSRTKPTIQH